MKKSVLVIVSMLAPVWAFAQNGVMLINQSTVTASGTNRSAGGFPYNITQPGSYQLSGNLTVPPGLNGIVISASLVSLDLNGFNISCVGSCSGNAGNGITDNGTPQSGITIEKGAVVGFNNGIFMEASTGSFIERVTAQSNRANGIVVGTSSTIKDCFGLNNGGDGIVAGLHSIVSGSVASGNGSGIDVGTGTRLLFSFVIFNDTFSSTIPQPQLDTILLIYNLSLDSTIGSQGTPGTCALNYFGDGIPPGSIPPVVTFNQQGGVIETVDVEGNLQTIFNGSFFEGYVIALCNFKAQGYAYTLQNFNGIPMNGNPAIVNP